MNSLITRRTVRLSKPSEDDRRAYDQRLADALGHSCSIRLPVLRKLSSLARSGDEISCIIAQTGDSSQVIDISERSYSIALDIGSTNLVVLLYDNINSTDVLTRSLENPQVGYGSDILTRMHHVMAGGTEVYDALREGIHQLIEEIRREAAIDVNDIHGMVVAGNTAMTHFFLGLDVTTIPVDPFTPVVRTPGFFSASELSLPIHPEAIVYVFPNAGSYVGGDITSGILASGMHLSEKISVLIDVGTNAEVVIGNRDWMIVGAGAAGPALEEGISGIGKRAKRGIIYDVEIRNDGVSYKTFDQAEPEGICGSGMVSLLHELYKAGIIDQRGMFAGAGGTTIIDDEPAFPLLADNTLFVTQNEIQNFMKSKAAMFTLLLALVRSVGIMFKDIEQVYVSGALGTGIDANKAIGIGMLPEWPPEIVTPLGNSSLRGATLLLQNADMLKSINAIAEKLTYKHMHDDPEFMKEYMGAVFIPHTNPDLLKMKFV